MTKTTPKQLTEKQWRDAADAYELGTKHGAQIAREFGVSASTVSREFGRRGCIKARRVGETVAALEAELDAKHGMEARRRATQEAAGVERSAVLDKLMGSMMKSLIAADKAGRIAAAGPVIERVRRSLSS